MNFNTLKERIELSANSGFVELSIINFNEELLRLSAIIGDLLELKLQLTIPAEITADRITIKGTVKPYKNISFILTAVFQRQGENISAVLMLQPDINMKGISGELKNIINLIPVSIDSWTVVLNTDALAARAIQVGDKTINTSLKKGTAYFFKLESKLLEFLKIEDQIYSVQRMGEDVIRLTTNIHLEVSLAKLITIQLKDLSFPSRNTIELYGKLSFNFFGLTLSSPDTGQFLISLQAVNFSFEIPDEFIPTFLPAFKAITLTQNKAHFEGNISSGSIAIGLSGNFSIKGSNSTGTYAVKKSTTPGPLPDLFEFKASELTMSSMATALTGFVITLPEFFNRLIVLNDVYLYYASQLGMFTSDGEPARVGMAGHSNIRLLGYESFGEFEAYENSGVKGRILLDPLSFGNLAQISGNGKKSGHSEKDCMELMVNTGTKEARADIQVVFLKASKQAVIANLTQNGLEFTVSYKPLSFRDLQFQGALSNHTELKFNARFEEYLSGPMGLRFSALFTVGCEGKINTSNKVLFRVGAKVEIRKVISISLPIVEIDPDKLVEVVNKMCLEILDQLVDLFYGSVGVLFAIVKEVIENLIAEGKDVPEKILSEVGKVLRDQYKKTVDEAVKLAKAAEMTGGQIIGIAQEYFEDGYQEPVIAALKKLGISDDKILQSFKEYYCNYVNPVTAASSLAGFLKSVYPVETVTHLLRELPCDPEKITKMFSYCGYEAEHAAKGLKSIGLGVEEVGRLVGTAYDTLKSTKLEEALIGAGFLLDPSRKIVQTVFKEQGRILEEARKVLTITFRKFKLPRIKFTW